MCGGYYEEELTYYGPSTEFKTVTGFGRAAAICELENIACRLDPEKNRIHFKNIKEEERFSIAFQKRGRGYYD